MAKWIFLKEITEINLHVFFSAHSLFTFLYSVAKHYSVAVVKPRQDTTKASVTITHIESSSLFLSALIGLCWFFTKSIALVLLGVLFELSCRHSVGRVVSYQLGGCPLSVCGGIFALAACVIVSLFFANFYNITHTKLLDAAKMKMEMMLNAHKLAPGVVLLHFRLSFLCYFFTTVSYVR